MPAARSRRISSRARIGLACLLLLFAATATAPIRAELPREKERWIRLQTEHFTLLSNTAEVRTRRIGENLEALREVLSRTSTGLEVNSPLPTRIFVFRNRASFDRYNLHQGDKPAQVAGFFIKSEDGNFVALDASAGTEPFGVIYHEYLHYFLRNNFPDLPVWLGEGLAEFYSTFQWQEDRAELGHPIDSHLFWLAHNPMSPLDRLLHVDTDSPDYNETERQGTFYAQSWLLTHYVMTQDKGKSAAVLLGKLHDGERPDTALEQTLGQELLAVEKSLAAYAKNSTFSYFTFRFEEGLDGGEASVTPVERPDLLFELGNLLLHTPPLRAAVAEEHLQAAIAADPERPAAYTAMGLLRQRQERSAEASEYYRRAIALGPKTAWPYRALGRQLIDTQVGLDLERQETLPPAVVEARKLFRQCLGFSPGDPECLAGVGRSYLRDAADVSAGIDAMEQAVRALPSRDEFLFQLLLLYMHDGREESARALVDGPLARRGEPELHAAAEDMLLEFDVERAREQLAADNVDEAVEILQGVADRANDDGYRQSILTELMALRGAVVSAESADLYNRAVQKANDGDPAAAIAMLEQVVAEARDPSLKQMAASSLESIRRVDRHNRVVEQFNLGVQAANEGRLDEAIAALEKALSLEPEAGQRAMIEETLARLRRASRR